MINNLSTILHEIMKQTNKNKENKENKEKGDNKHIPDSFLKNKFKIPCNLKINIELADRKSMELYKKYNTNTKQVPKFSILDKEVDKEVNKTALVEYNPNKGVLTIYGICVFAFLAYSYFKKR